MIYDENMVTSSVADPDCGFWIVIFFWPWIREMQMMDVNYIHIHIHYNNQLTHV